MSAAPNPDPPRRRRRWLRWVLLALGLLVVAFLVLLRPIAFYAARYYAEKFGESQHLKIAFDPGGNLWTRLSVDRVQASPTAPGFLREAKVGHFAATYSLWSLLRSGLGDFVDAVELSDVNIVIDATRPSPPSPPAAAPPDGKAGGLPKIPLPRKLVLRNVNVTIEGPAGQRTELVGLTLELLPAGEGKFVIQRLALPGLQPIENITARTSYLDRDLHFREFDVPRVAHLSELALDLGKLPAGRLDGALDGTVLGGALDAKFSLPASLDPGTQPASGTFSLKNFPIAWPSQVLPDPPTPPPALGGSVDQLDFSFGNRANDASKIDARLSVRARDVRVNDAAVPAVSIQATLTMEQAAFTAKNPWFAGLQAEMTGDVTSPHGAGVAVDRIGFRLRAAGERATIETMEVVRGANTVSLTGNATLPAEVARWQQGPLDLKIQINAPDLGQLSLEGQPPLLLGRLQGGGAVALRAGAWEGDLALTGQDLLAREQKIQSIDARIMAGKGLAWIDHFVAQIDPENTASLGGYARLEGDRDFRAEIGAAFSKLANFEPALRAAGMKQPVAGSLNVALRLNGSLKDPAQLVKTLAGGGNVSVRGLTVGANGPMEADLEGTLAAAKLDLANISVRSGQLEFRGSAQLADAMLQLEDISFRRGTEQVAGGHVRVPVDLDRMTLADRDKFDVNVTTARPLRLAEIWSAGNLAGTPPLEGTLAFSATARGSLSNLQAEVSVQGRSLRRADLSKLRPADLDLALRVNDRRLVVDGSARQPQMQPLTIRGEVPVDLKQLIETGRPDLNARVTGAVRLPPSSLGVLIGVVPGLRFIQGTAAADIDIGGTLGQPTLRGAVRADLPAARFEDLSIPALRNFKVRITFDEKLARFEQFQGEVAGGTLNVSGQAEIGNYPKGAIQLAITTKDLLALRDDNVTVRVNSDLKVAGPISAALVSGNVALTKSRFLKDIDILPLNLPGERRKPASAPAPPRPRSTGANVGINTPPLRDWKFDVRITTADPFRIRGNLANGRITLDLRLTGTGARPQLEGPVTVEQLAARLPFSRLEFSYGTIYFSPDQPLNPLLNLSGESQIRDRHVNVSVFGRANDPRIVFTSDPPLPQEQIISLLATGSTIDELTSGSGALAGKAAILAAQSLWRKIFKTKDPGPGEESIADRFDVDIGSTDPRTGKQSVAARFRMSDRVVLLSDFDAEGNFRGQVRYLIRFR